MWTEASQLVFNITAGQGKQIKKGRNQLITTLSIYSCVQITQL